MTLFVVIVTDPENSGYTRSPFNRGVNVTYPASVDRFNVNEHQVDRNTSWWMCETQEWAETTAQDLAKRYPTKIVKVAKVISEFQSEIPKIAKKVVSERGSLPG